MATLNIKGFPEGLYRTLREDADREHRSLSQHVVHLLSRSVERREPSSVLELRGLGKELWSEIEAEDHVAAERAAWD